MRRINKYCKEHERPFVNSGLPKGIPQLDRKMVVLEDSFEFVCPLCEDDADIFDQPRFLPEPLQEAA